MGVEEESCETRLVLGLGSEKMAKKSPPLTLSLFGEAIDDVCGGQDSAASSLSNVSVKRERDEEVDDTEDHRVSSDDDGSNGRKKLRLNKAQSALLEESFKHHSTLNPKQKQELARELKLRPRQVEVWFQNRRARTKLKQTELDCELLKRCCETLTDENRRLHKELHDLKALKLAPPLYMHLPPAAALAICPTCERIGGGAASSEKAAKTSFAKPHFYNPFTNPSAAC
ncbi:homeobox-leucine zipper protein HAT22-like [Salvia splendens]|uniref:homeobox-leucine zipper protein HAT22-like n=1 Tax=Salvia splendens TaxID=180675 RepID=UPI001C27D463|nr:homeobox-leucine zipper protein HAT22-like [Salvia splendens]